MKSCRLVAGSANSLRLKVVIDFRGPRRMLPGSRRRTGFGLRLRKSALIEILDEIFGEKNVQRPIDGYAHFLFGARQFAPVNPAPEKPGEEPGKIYAENSRHTGATADRG